MYRYFVNNVYDDYTKFDDRLYKGYYAEDIAWEAPSIEAIQPYYAEVDSITLQTFRNYIAETKREGIHLILVSAPVYARAPQIVLNENEIFQLYVSLANQYDIPLLDYRNMSICGDTLYFHNVTHLNRKGAEIFSAQLAHDLDSLGLIKR